MRSHTDSCAGWDSDVPLKEPAARNLGFLAESVVTRAFFRVPEACEILAVGRTELYRLIASGQLQAVKFGRATRIPSTALRAFIEAKTNGGR